MISIPRTMTVLNQPEKWVLDTECIRHMVNRREYLNIFEAVQGPIQAGGQEVMKSEGHDTVGVITVVNEIKKRITLHAILYVPRLLYDLISI